MTCEKIYWQDEGLDTYYRKMGYPKKIWVDNEGLPFGIRNEHECYWYASEDVRDKEFEKYFTVEDEEVTS